MPIMDEEVQYDNLEFHEKLGEGAFGTVNRVIFKKPFKGYEEAAGKSVRGMRKEEIEIMQTLNHPNIVTWLGFYSKGPLNLILMEYAQNGSLHNSLHDQSKHLPESLKRKWAKESALAIDYLHDHKCLHRDIKPNNCLLFDNDTLKLCDFGLAREVDNSFTLSTAKGTYQYMAPEIINTNADNKGSFSIFTDIYAYGMLLLAIYTRQTPFQGKEYAFVTFNVGNGTLQPDIPKYVPEDIAKVMKQCWEVEPRKRPTMKSILKSLGVRGVSTMKRGIESHVQTVEDITLKMPRKQPNMRNASENTGGLSKWTMQRQIKPQVKGIDTIALHPNGCDMVVATMTQKQVHCLDRNGKVKWSQDSPDTGTWSDYIMAVSISPQGHMFIVENRSHLITVFTVFDETCTFLTSFSILDDGEDPSTLVYPEYATIDRNGNLLVIDSTRGVITIHKCPGGEMIGDIKIKVKWDHKYIYMRCIVNSKSQILLHYSSPYISVYSKVVAIDYSGKELYSFTPKIDINVKLVPTTQGEVVNEEWVYTGGIVCDSKGNIIIALVTANHLNTVTRTCKVKVNTGHIHMYTPTGTFLKCIAKGLHCPSDLSMSQDGSSIAVGNGESIQIYGLE